MIAIKKPGMNSKQRTAKPTRSARATTTASADGKLSQLRERAQRLLELEIAFMPNAEFSQRNAARTILGEAINLDFAAEPSSHKGIKLPSYLARMCDAPLLGIAEEKSLFRRMNYLRHRAHALQTKLSVRRPNASRMDELEELLEQADMVKQRIVGANIRLVVSIVKQLASTPIVFEELLSEGLLAMIRATEKFDFDRGFRFSTYATMVIRRQLYRSMKNDHRDRGRFPIGDPALFAEHAEHEVEPRIGYHGWVQLNDSLLTMLAELDDRERYIICARFGFETDGKKQTLQSLANEIGVCKERVRQLEKRAMAKLQTLADGGGLVSFLDMTS